MQDYNNNPPSGFREDSKTCSKCQIPKPLSQFYAGIRYRQGVLGQCKSCRLEYSRELHHRKKYNRKTRPIFKRCRTCGETKPSAWFGSKPTNSDGLRSRCNQCRTLMERKPPEEITARSRQALCTKYGITWERFTEMLESQQRQCAICKRSIRRPVIDHCHKTGRVRGLLCFRCNNWLAAIEHPGFIEQAIEYLKC